MPFGKKKEKESPRSGEEGEAAASSTDTKKDVEEKSKEKGNSGDDKGKDKGDESVKKPEKKTTAGSAKRVLTPEEMGRMIDLGLGRGVNATSSTPWFQKSSFQVREVTPSNIVGTEEGGILQSYVNEVESIEDIQTQMSASIPASEQVSIGIDAELSRSYSTSRKSMGKKIVTRSISFKPDMDEVSPADVLEVTPVTPKPVAESAEASAHDKGKTTLPSFEQRLALWIIERLLDEEVKGLQEFIPGICPVDRLSKFIIEWPGGIKEVKEIVRQKCIEFVAHFDVTHYVSSIELGASQYQVLSEDQFMKQVGVKNSLEVLKVVSAVFENKKTTRQISKSSQATEIGRIEGKTVVRGTIDEAVVGVKFRPISALVRTRVLQSLLQSAIKNYITDQEHSRAGPFIISCNNESIFLKVTSRFQVVATSRIEDSSDFYISYNEDGHSAYEFSITYMASSSLEGREIKPISRYLYAPVNSLGKFGGPLVLRLDATDIYTKMTLHSRRERHSDPVDTKNWMNSRDIFYISCKQRFLLSDSYICVKTMPQASALTEEYTTCCVPTVRKHNESRERYMLFRLIRATKRRVPDMEKKKNLENELLGIRRVRISTLSPVISAAEPMVEAESGIQMNIRGNSGRGLVEVENETEM